jgi:hypothetical protein
MSKLIGKRKRDYLGELVAQQPGVDGTLAEAITTRLDAGIRSLRASKTQRAAARTSVQPVATVPAPSPATSRSFDPYAFNAILTFKRAGRAALEGKLAEIGEIGHLRQLAEAQLIGLDKDMRSGEVAIEDLREAVLRGVERLVADRRAAAS